MGMDCDEVYPGIIIGTGPTVKNLKYLVKLGVTHVLNTAENDVNISPGRYAKEGIMYKGAYSYDVHSGWGRRSPKSRQKKGKCTRTRTGRYLGKRFCILFSESYTEIG